jgi:hypothetical protein
MSSDVCRIVELWKRSRETGWEWVRRREREFVYSECEERLRNGDILSCSRKGHQVGRGRAAKEASLL